MTMNPYAPGSPPIAAGRTGSDTRSPRFIGSNWHATMRGARIGGFIAGPLSLLLIVPALAITTFGVAGERSLGCAKNPRSRRRLRLVIRDVRRCDRVRLGRDRGPDREDAQSTSQANRADWPLPEPPV